MQWQKRLKSLLDWSEIDTDFMWYWYRRKTVATGLEKPVLLAPVCQCLPYTSDPKVLDPVPCCSLAGAEQREIMTCLDLLAPSFLRYTRIYRTSPCLVLASVRSILKVGPALSKALEQGSTKGPLKPKLFCDSRVMCHNFEQFYAVTLMN